MLSSSEVEQLYNVTPPIGSLSPISEPVARDAQVARYPLDGNADDAWGNNNGSNNGVKFENNALYGQSGKFNKSEND